MKSEIGRTASSRRWATRASLLAAVLMAAGLSGVEPGVAGGETARIELGRSHLRYFGTNADTHLVIRLAEDSVTFVNRGDEVLGDVGECEHIPSGGPDGAERVICPERENLRVRPMGATTENRVIVKTSRDDPLADFLSWGKRARDIVRLRAGGFLAVRFIGRRGDDLFVASGRESESEHADGGLGNDVLKGSRSPSNLVGGRGDDRLHGGPGRIDWMFGGRGDDVVRGGGGRDFMYGNPGRDALYGGPDSDHLYGDEPNRAREDAMDCGAGRDTEISDRLDQVVRCERSPHDPFD